MLPCFSSASVIRASSASLLVWSRVVRQRCVGKQDQVLAPLQPVHDLRGGFFSGKLAEILFDVLDFERALLEIVLSDVIFHG